MGISPQRVGQVIKSKAALLLIKSTNKSNKNNNLLKSKGENAREKINNSEKDIGRRTW